MKLEGILYRCLDDNVPILDDSREKVISYMHEDSMCLLITHAARFVDSRKFHRIMFDGVIGMVDNKFLIRYGEEDE